MEENNLEKLAYYYELQVRDFIPGIGLVIYLLRTDEGSSKSYDIEDGMHFAPRMVLLGLYNYGLIELSMKGYELIKPIMERLL